MLHAPPIEVLENRIAPSTLDYVNGILIFTAGAGELNTIDFRIQNGAYLISDGATPTITQAAAFIGCTSPSPGTATAPTFVNGVVFNLGDMNDTLNVQGLATPLTVNGDGGSDTFTTNNFSFPSPTLTANGAVFIDTESITISNCAIAGATSLTFKTDNLQVNKTVAASRGITLLPSTAGREFDLGTENAARVSLTAAETANLFGAVTIGDGTSSIIIDGAVSFGGLKLLATEARTITQTGSGAITAGNLIIDSVQSVSLNGANDVTDLTARVTGSGANFSFTDATGFSVSPSFGLSGVSTNGGTVSFNAGAVTQGSDAPVRTSVLQLAGAGPYTLDSFGNNVATLTGSTTNAITFTDLDGFTVGVAGLATSNAPIELRADNLNFTGPVNASTASVKLSPLGGATSIDLGGADVAGATLGITDAELGFVTAGSVQIGAAGSTAAMSVSGAIAPANFSTLQLNAGNITGGGSIAIPTLDVRSAGSFAVSGASDVNTLSINSSTSASGMAFTDADGFTLAEYVVPGVNPFSVDVGTATLALSSSLNLKFDFNNPTVSTGFDRLTVTGTVTIGSTTQFSLSATGTVPAGKEFVIISNDGTDAITGTFDGLAEGDAIPGLGIPATITYTGGDGNDVAIVTADPLTPGVGAGGKTLFFTDVDGDAVTITASKGALSSANIIGFQTGRPDGGSIFQKLKLDATFTGADITITAKPGASGGNGFVNLGYLDAVGVDLGTVTIAGDVARISAGSVGGDAKIPAIKALTVQSVGLLGDSALAAADQGFIGIETQGALPKLTVKDDLRGKINVDDADGNLGTATIGGSIVGPLTIEAAGSIGLLKVAGDIRGLAGSISITARGGVLGALTVDGSILGKDPLNPVEIKAYGQPTAPTKGADIAIKTITVKGGVENARILAGAAGGLNADASIGSIAVGGDWLASIVTAGTNEGPDTRIGSADDTKYGGGVRDNPAIASSIGSFTVKGQAFGTGSDTGDMFGVVAEQIAKAKVGSRTFAFTKNPDAFFAAPTVTGGGAENPKFDFTIRELGAATPGGTITGGVNLKLSADGKTATFNDVDGDLVTVKRTLGTFDAADFTITTAASGGGRFDALTLPAAPGNLTITAKPGPDGGNGWVNVGRISTVAPTIAIGGVSLAGDLGAFMGGATITGKPGVGSLTVHSIGVANTNASGAPQNSTFVGGLGKLTTDGDLRATQILAIGAGEAIGAVSIGGQVFFSAIVADAGIASVKTGGTLYLSSLASISGALGTITIGGDFIGSGVVAFGQGTQPAKSPDVAIKSISIEGGSELSQIEAGASTIFGGTKANADASIGALVVGHLWQSSSVRVGVDPGVDGKLGTADDVKAAGTNSTRDRSGVFSSIASVTIKGQAFGSTATDDSFGIVAEQIGAATLGSVKLKLDKGERDAADQFAIAPTSPGAGTLPFDFYLREVIA